MADANDEQVAATDAETPLVGVMDPDAGNAPVETHWNSGVGAAAVAADATEDPEPVRLSRTPVKAPEEGAQEPVAVAAEAQVVMPRSSGAGSWLRWPSSTVDRSTESVSRLVLRPRRPQTPASRRSSRAVLIGTHTALRARRLRRGAIVPMYGSERGRRSSR